MAISSNGLISNAYYLSGTALEGGANTIGNTAQLPNKQKYDIIDIWKDK